eukprot:CAMPEP_0172318394 /NCGR_PEP_ID=MMETSP1058-20130122/34783_1 /TAXON_ID=83371 /ORGANISM="Detonula confervacea, Strain CCMP 353" /LENGTH=69 /DNA_ID=CAMNT_0013033225 /DNA_START=27 /DNA_END=233 /DNA_ORIENTATION=-
MVSKRSLKPIRTVNDIVLAAKEVHRLFKKQQSSEKQNVNLEIQKQMMEKLNLAITLREKMLGKTGSRSD